MIEGSITVHDCERMLGMMESVRPVTPYAALHYRSVQRQLLDAKYPSRNPNKVIKLSRKSLVSLKWWVASSGFSANSTAPIRELAPTVNIWTDAT